MKQLSLLLAFTCMLITACNNGHQNEAKALSQGIQNIQNEIAPGSIATSANVIYFYI